MIIEFTYNNKNICNECNWLNLDKDGWTGICTCPYSKVRNKYRHITDKKCSWKNANKIINRSNN